MCAGNAPGDVSDTVAFLHDYLRVTSHTTHHSPSNTPPPAPYALHTPSRPAPPLPKDDDDGNVVANTPQPQAETVIATITTKTTTPVEDTNAIELPRRYSWRRQVGSLAIHQTTVVEADKAAAYTTTTTPHAEAQRKAQRSTPRASSASSSSEEKEAQHVTTAAAPRRSIVPHIRTAAASHNFNVETPHHHHHHSLARNTHMKNSSRGRHHAVPRRSAPQLFESSTSSAWQHSLSRPAIIPPPGPLQEEEHSRSRSVLRTRVALQHDRQTRHHPLAFTPPPSASHSLLTSGSAHRAQHNKYHHYKPTNSSSNSSRHTRLRSSTMRQRTNGASRSEQLSFVPVQSIEAIYKQNNSTRDHASTRLQHHQHRHRSYQSSAPNASKASALPMTSTSLVFPPHSSPSHSSASSSASHSTVRKRNDEARSHSKHYRHNDLHRSASHSLHRSRGSSGQRTHSTSHASSSHIERQHRHTTRVEDSTQTPAQQQQQPHVTAKNAASTSTSQAAINAPLSLIQSGAEHSAILRHIVSYLKSYYARDAAVEAQRGIETMSSEDLLGLMQCIYMDFYHLIRTAQLRRGLDVVQSGYAAPDPTPLVTASSSSTIHSAHHIQPHRHASSSSNAASLLRGRSGTHPPTRHEDVPSPFHNAHHHHHSSSRRSSASASAHVSRYSSHKSRYSHAVQPTQPTTTAPQSARSHSSHKPTTTTAQQQQKKGNVQVIQAKVPVFVSPCSSPRSTVLSSSPPLSSNRGGPSPAAAVPINKPMANARLPQALNCAVNRPYSVSSHSHTASSLSTSAPRTHSASTSRATRHHHSLSSSHHHHSHKSNTPARQHAPHVRTSQADGMVNSAPSHSLHTGDTQGRTPLRHTQGNKGVATVQHTTSERQRQADTFTLHKAASSLRAPHQRKTPSPRKSVSIAPSVTVTSSSLNNNNNSNSSESGVSRLQSLMSQLRQGVNALKYIAHNRPPHLRYFRVEDRFASFRGSGVLMPHLVWKPLNQGGVGLNTSSASARMRAEGLNLIQLRAVTRGSGSGPACPGYELFYRRHGHVIDRKGDVVPEHLCAVLVFTAKTIAVSFLREQDQLLWMEALTGVVQRNQTLRF